MLWAWLYQNRLNQQQAALYCAMTIDLETERLLLRPFQREDLDAFVAYRNDPEVARYQSWETPFTVRKAERLLDAMQRFTPGGPDGWYQVAIVLRQTGEMIGDCAFCILEESPD